MLANHIAMDMKKLLVSSTPKVAPGNFGKGTRVGLANVQDVPPVTGESQLLPSLSPPRIERFAIVPVAHSLKWPSQSPLDDLGSRERVLEDFRT
mmetsp:Transcript_11741/g.19144  ORF Transcript_11741/g.19144 Transcript_11741/m.19144 type:complete len:94 (-) Transcript_11741:702-983(-)